MRCCVATLHRFMSLIVLCTLVAVICVMLLVFFKDEYSSVNYNDDGEGEGGGEEQGMGKSGSELVSPTRPRGGSIDEISAKTDAEVSFMVM
jgi:hypothetical protein